MGKGSKRKRAVSDKNRAKGKGPETSARQRTEEVVASPTNRNALALPIVILLVVSFAVYFNTLFNEFVYDDSSQVLKNYWIRDVRNLPKIFAKSVWAFQSAPVVSNYYRPIMNVLYMVNYHLFGLKPWGFHLVNVLFHAGASVLVFLITARLGAGSFPDPSPSPLARGRTLGLLSLPFIAALLFAVHPVHTEAVAWVAGLPDLSFTFFFLLSFALYIRSTMEQPVHKGLYSISVASFFLSALSKEPALTLPLILMGHDHLSGRPEDGFRGRWKLYVPYFVAAAVYFALRLYALGGIAPERRHEQLSALQHVINIFPLFSDYLGKLLLPVNLNAFHVFHPIASIWEWAGILSVAVAAAYIGITAVAYRKNRMVCFCLLFIVVPLLPAFYIRGLGLNTFAERYLYLPSVGFVALAAMFLTKTAEKSSRGTIVLIGALALVTGLYSLGTIRRNAVWRSDYTLFEDTTIKSPDSAIAREKFATALMEQGRLDEAIRHFIIALNLDDSLDDAHTNLGIAYYRKGMLDQAIEEERISIALNPNLPEKHFNLAQQLADKQIWEAAIREYEIAIALDPNFADAHNGLGFSCAMAGSIDKAIGHFENAVRLAPDNPMYAKNLSRAREMKNEASVRKGTGKQDRME
jgi:protein O-mannosyl-transferase